MAQPSSQFRETMWFKRGDLVEPQPADDEAPAAPTAALLPIEDRYADDGSLSPADRAAFGLHTGTTEFVPLLRDAPAEPPDAVLPLLARELKRTRGRMIVALGAIACVATAVVIVLI